MGWVFDGGDSMECGRGIRGFAVVQNPTGLFSPGEKEKRSQPLATNPRLNWWKRFLKSRNAQGDLLSFRERKQVREIVNLNAHDRTAPRERSKGEKKSQETEGQVYNLIIGSNGWRKRNQMATHVSHPAKANIKNNPE